MVIDDHHEGFRQFQGPGQPGPDEGADLFPIVGSQGIAHQFSAFCSALGASVSGPTASKRSPCAFYVKAFGNDAMTIIRSIYDRDGPVLARKHDTAVGILAKHSGRSFRTLRKAKL